MSAHQRRKRRLPCEPIKPRPQLTFDHVKPRSHGGVTEWRNVVSACDPCNLKKANRLDTRPLKTPVEPTSYELNAAKRKFPPNYLHESWLDYLYWDSEIEN